MKIVEIVKDFFSRLTKDKNVKRIPEKTTENDGTVEIKKLNFQAIPDLRTKTERLTHYLKKIGATSEVFLLIENMESLDFEEVQSVCQLLQDLKYSKVEINKILAENIKILYTEEKEIKANIKEYYNFFKDEFLLKNLLYSWPEMFTNTTKTEKIVNIFNQYEIPMEYQCFILWQNNELFLIAEKGIEKSLQLIKRVSGNNQIFFNSLISVPEIVGKSDYTEIQRCISE